MSEVAKKANEKNPLPSNVTLAQYNEWKLQYGTDALGQSKVFIIVLKSKYDHTKEFRCVVRQPDHKILSQALPHIEKNMKQLTQVLIVNCWLGGDEEIKNSPDLSIQAGSKLIDFLDRVDSEIVNF